MLAPGGKELYHVIIMRVGRNVRPPHGTQSFGGAGRIVPIKFYAQVPQPVPSGACCSHRAEIDILGLEQKPGA
jgi:hypothetical protein